jgi:shikimate kinase
MFKKFGEEFFRQEEEKSFIKIQNMPKTIISLGGGSLASDLIRNTVQQSENSFYLKNEFRNLWQYIKNSDRPLVDLGEVEVMNIYHNRLKSYEQCRNIVDMSKHSLQEASKIIVAQLGWD